MTRFVLLAAASAVALTAAAASAETLRWARAGDALTLDPHAQNEGPTHALAHQIYEGLLQRDMTGQIIPALATSWKPTATWTSWGSTERSASTATSIGSGGWYVARTGSSSP